MATWDTHQIVATCHTQLCYCKTTPTYTPTR
uniref:Uncharacterized protein n=1 Tax=Triticum urartu TaxID=4572 RepID=A0A8R7R6W2_TRIUA